MAADGDETVYYVISYLHTGGDEQLAEVEFLAELLSFLRRLARTDENAEIVINGDAFGLLEFTTVEGTEKFDVLVETSPDRFEPLRATGESIPPDTSATSGFCPPSGSPPGARRFFRKTNASAWRQST